jgi:hypothetical protein
MKKHIITFLILFFMNKVNSQPIQNKVEKIKQNFEELEKYNLKDLSKEDVSNSFYPFYEHSVLREYLIKEKVTSESLCVQYSHSKRMRILKDIYILYFNKNNSQLINLIDDSFNIIYDLKLSNCSGMKDSRYTTLLINKDKIDSLEISYRKWFKILEDKGEDYIKKNNITPTSFSNYKWIEEIGFIRDNDEVLDIIDLSYRIINNNNYMDYFIKTNDLNRFYKGLDNKNIISQIAILTFINKFKPFTHNIFNFSIQFNSISYDSNSLLNDLIKLKESERNILLFNMLNNNEIIIKLTI